MRRAATALALVLVLALAAVAVAATVNAPKSGRTYEGGPPSDVVLQVEGRSVEIVAFSFPCTRTVTGRTSLNALRLKRTSRGYRFNGDAHGLITHSDEAGDENGETHISGRFTLDARSVRGHLRVRSRRCGDSGVLSWRADID